MFILRYNAMTQTLARMIESPEEAAVFYERRGGNLAEFLSDHHDAKGW
jgi:hypothetical protein